MRKVDLGAQAKKRRDGRQLGGRNETIWLSVESTQGASPSVSIAMRCDERFNGDSYAPYSEGREESNSTDVTKYHTDFPLFFSAIFLSSSIAVKFTTYHQLL